MSKIYGKFGLMQEINISNRYHKNYIELISNSIPLRSKIFDVGIGTGIPFADSLQKRVTWSMGLIFQKT